MKAITFVTQKGGSGKSTLCINLAVAAQEAGHSVCILEMDRQATISDWAEQHQARAVNQHVQPSPFLTDSLDHLVCLSLIGYIRNNGQCLPT